MRKVYEDSIFVRKWKEYTAEEKKRAIISVIFGIAGFLMLGFAQFFQSTTWGVLGFIMFILTVMVFWPVIKVSDDENEEENGEEFQRCIVALEKVLNFDHNDIETAYSEWFSIKEDWDYAFYEISLRTDFSAYADVGIVRDNILFCIMTDEDQEEIQRIVKCSERADEVQKYLTKGNCRCQLIGNGKAHGCVIFDPIVNRMVIMAYEDRSREISYDEV